MSIVAISDIHLGANESNEEHFRNFLKSLDFDQIDDIVLLGDIIDLWRRDYKNAIRESTETLELLANIHDETTVHYIAGNHDYLFLDMKEDLGFPFKAEKSLVIPSGSTDFYFTHGYELEVSCFPVPYHFALDVYESFSKRLCLEGDDTGNALECVWDSLKSSASWLSGFLELPTDIYLALESIYKSPKIRLRGEHQALDSIEKLAKSNGRYSCLGLKPNQFLVYGHTHRPYIDIYNRVANTGCWGVEDNKDCSYIEIIDGEPHLRYYHEG